MTRGSPIITLPVPSCSPLAAFVSSFVTNSFLSASLASRPRLALHRSARSLARRRPPRTLLPVLFNPSRPPPPLPSRRPSVLRAVFSGISDPSPGLCGQHPPLCYSHYSSSPPFHPPIHPSIHASLLPLHLPCGPRSPPLPSSVNLALSLWFPPFLLPLHGSLSPLSVGSLLRRFAA